MIHGRRLQRFSHCNQPPDSSWRHQRVSDTGQVTSTSGFRSSLSQITNCRREMAPNKYRTLTHAACCLPIDWLLWHVTREQNWPLASRQQTTKCRRPDVDQMTPIGQLTAPSCVLTVLWASEDWCTHVSLLTTARSRGSRTVKCTCDRRNTDCDKQKFADAVAVGDLCARWWNTSVGKCVETNTCGALCVRTEYIV